MTIRNGRFTSARTIIVGRSGSYFRILNSADFDSANANKNAIQLFTADQDGTNPVNLGASIAEGESFDFVSPGQGKKVVFVKTAGTASHHIEGIYNFITNA